MQKIVERLINIICLIVCVWIIGCQFLFNTGWENKKIYYLIGSFIYLLFFCKIKTYLYNNEEKIKKYFGVILIAFIFVYGIVQIAIGFKLRFDPIFDLEAIFGGAIEWYETGNFAEHYEYFYRFKNNLGGLLILYLSNLLGGVFTQDYFLISMITNCIGIWVTFCLLALICREIWGEVSAIICLCGITLMIPFLFMGAVFYTDSLSVPYVVGSIFIYLKMRKSNDVKKKIFFAIALGFCIVMGAWIKGSVWIILVAAILILCLHGERKEVFTCVPAMLATIFVVNFFLNSFFYDGYLNDETEKEKKLSVTHWIMMGLEGNGGYNPSDYEFSYGILNAQKRKEANIEVIKDRLAERGAIGTIQLFVAKTVNDYGEGTLGLSDFLDDNPIERNELHDYVLYDGVNYENYQSYCRIILLLFWVCFLYAIIKKMKSNQVSEMFLLIELAFVGLFIFLMIWESSCRYISNFIPIMILGAVGGVAEIKEDKVNAYIHKLWENRSIRIFSYAIIFRIAIYMVYICIMAIYGDYQNGITMLDFLDAWKRWDAAHYLNIAQNGYSGAIENGQHLFLVFLPLYPWLIEIVELLCGNYQLAGIIISVVCFGIGCVYFDKILRLEYSEEIAETSMFALVVFPFAFFFGSIMTESLFFAIVAAFFYYLRKHEWGVVTFCGFLACMTKIQGVLLTLSIIAELFYSFQGFKLIRQKKWKDFIQSIIVKGLKCVPMVAGTGVYLLVNFVVEGDAFRFMFYQKNHWGNSLCPIWETISYVARKAFGEWFTSTGMSLWVPEFILFFVYIVAIIYGFQKKMRPTYLVYLIAFFLLTYSSTWLISGGRYTLSALPLFMLAGQFLKEHKRVKSVLIPISFALMIVYMIGYYQWKQIM